MPQPAPSLWAALDAFRPPQAIPILWQEAAGPDYAPLREHFLRNTGTRAGRYPCPTCGAPHEVICHDEGVSPPRSSGPPRTS